MKTETFEVNGYQATVLLPENPNGKWVWKTEFFGAFDTAESELLDLGYTYKVVVSGSQTAVGEGTSYIESFKLYDRSGKEVTSDFKFRFEPGKLVVSEHIITIYLHQIQKTYDGTALSFRNDDYEIVSIKDGLTLANVTINISRIDVGSITVSEINSNIEDYISYTVYYQGYDITQNVTLVVAPFEFMDTGSYIPLEVKERVIKVITGSSKVAYEEDITLSDPTVSICFGELVEGHSIKVTNSSTLDTVATVTNYVQFIIVDENGQDVTYRYNIAETINGTLEIYNE